MTFYEDKGELKVKRQRLLNDGALKSRKPNHVKTMLFLTEKIKFVGENKLRYVSEGIDVVFTKLVDSRE